MHFWHRRKQHEQTENTVYLGDDGIIHLSFKGPQNDANTAPIYEKTKRLVAELRRTRKPVLMLGDVTGITTQDSGSRVQAKKLMELDYDSNAIIGSTGLMPIIIYVMRSSRPGRVKAFRNKREASLWLHGKEKRNNHIGRKAAGTALLAVSIAVLVGWTVDSDWLIRGYSSWRPVHPITAVGMFLLGCGLWASTSKTWTQRISTATVAWGALILLPEPWTHVSRWLFENQIIAKNLAFIATSNGWSFILCGLLLYLHYGKTKKQMPWLEHIKYALIGTVLAISLVIVIAYLYSPNYLFQYNYYLTSSPLVGCLFLLFISGLYERRQYKRNAPAPAGSWLSITIIGIIVVVQILTALSWREARLQTEQTTNRVFAQQTDETVNAINDRLQTYIDALYGFRGLFNSSVNVNEKEFSDYYNSLNLQTNYPGFRAISFIDEVGARDVGAFLKEMRSDRSLYPEGNPNFAISATSDQYFVLRYVANSRGSGLNLAADPVRRSGLERARDSGQPAATGTVAFAATAAQPEQKGFIITIPIYKMPHVPATIEERRAGIVGFVNAVFYYDALFSNVLSHADGFAFQVKDGGGPDAVSLYTDHDKAINQLPPERVERKEVQLEAAGRTWTVATQATEDFGAETSQAPLAATIIGAGTFLTLLLLLVLWLEIRSRQRAFDLADAMTQDLNDERNNAIAVQHKDEALLSSIGDGVFALDMNGRVILFNKAAAEISGYTAEEVLGKTYTDVLHFVNETDDTIETKFIDRALAGKQGSLSKHAALVGKDGTRVSVADSAAPIIDADGKQIGVIVVFRDVTHERQLEQAKDEFVSLVSHQLRTPLTAMRLFVEMILDEQVGKLNKGQRDYLEKVDISTNRMIQLVGDFLNTSRIELGRLRVSPEPTKLEELVTSHIAEIQPLADKKQITIKYTPHTLPEVPIDPGLYGQVVHNLLTNAIRYTKPGGHVTVTLSKHQAGYQLDVADTGIGIPQAAQSKLFGRFFRADNAVKVEGEGSGLGLYLVKKIVELCHGKIWYETAEGKGTTFHVIIPEKGMKARAGSASLK